MEKTKDNGTGGWVHLSVMNTFLSLALRVATSEGEGALRLASIYYCHIPSVTQVHSQGNICISDREFEMSLMWRQRSIPIPHSHVTQTGGRQGGGSSEEMPIFTVSPLNNFNNFPTLWPVFLCFVDVLPVSPPQVPFWSQIFINHSSIPDLALDPSSF